MNKTILPSAASLLLNEDCNLRCTYCFEKHRKGKMSNEVVRKSIDFLAANAVKNGDKFFNAMLFGGEPTTNLKGLEEALRYGIEVGERLKITFTASLVTNGVIMNDHLYKIIQKYGDNANLNIQLSIDGVQDIQDKYRITKDGKGSFEFVKRNVPIYKELFKHKPQELNIHGCVSPEMVHRMFENFKYFREEFGVSRLWFIPVVMDGWTMELVDVYREQSMLIYKYLIDELHETKDVDLLLDYAPFDRCISPDMFMVAPCGAGKNFVSITANGEIYPCHHFLFNDPEKTTLIGTLDTGIDEGKRLIFTDYDYTDISCAEDHPECSCFSCYRCPAENWTNNGSMFSQVDGIYCEFSKIDREIQLLIREELYKMGLMNKENNSIVRPDDCLCNVRGNSNMENTEKGCQGGSCNCQEIKEPNEILANALIEVLGRLERIEDVTNLILKRSL